MGNLRRNRLVAVGALCALSLVFMFLVVGRSANAQGMQQSWGSTVTCTTNSSGYCTATHPAAVVPDSVTVTPTSPAMVSVDQLTATTYRVRFCRASSSAGACTALVGSRTFYVHVDWTVGAAPSPSASSVSSAPASPSPSPSASSAPSGFPNASNTGVPAGVTLHSCATTINTPGTYDSCQFAGGLDVKVAGVTITRSEIDGQIGPPSSGGATALVIQDSTISCGCPSVGTSDAPAAIGYSNFTLTRVNLFGSAHGAAVSSDVVIQDSYIHGLGGSTDAHKDGIYSGDGTNVTLRHNNIDCNDGASAGCTSAIGILTDFTDITHWTIDNNLLNTNGSYCFYASGGPSKSHVSQYLSFTNNHFGRTHNANCGAFGPVTYWDSNQPGMVWSGNVWDDTGEAVQPVY